MAKKRGATKKPTKEKLAELATALRKDLPFRAQDKVFELAVEVGYLAASSDGELDAAERTSIVDALEVLSKGLVIELEVDRIVDDASAHADKKKRAADVGRSLKELGQAEAALTVGAFVAQATAGIDEQERGVLRAVGKAAGIIDSRIRSILKSVGDDEG
jgi:tellurite resistance protein